MTRRAVQPGGASRQRHVIAVFGPTGVGKTAVAVELAGYLAGQGEHPIAVSADALQVYEGLDVLCAKPSADQLARLEHRMLSCVPVDRTFSVGEFARRAHAEIDSLLADGAQPIVVGGTGLYLRAALAELDLRPPPRPGLREEIERELAGMGAEGVHGRLRRETARTIHPRDRKRIIRAAELERMGERVHLDADQLWSRRLRRPAALFGLVLDRELLAERISARVDRMLAGGAIEEVESALERNASATARKAIGFGEVEAYLRGEVGLEEVAERIKRRHRRYVKRQLTWMRKLSGVELVDRSGLSARQAAQEVARRVSRRVS